MYVIEISLLRRWGCHYICVAHCKIVLTDFKTVEKFTRIFSSRAEFLEDCFASVTQFIGLKIETLMKMAEEVKGEIFI